MVLWSVTLKIGALTKLGLFFPVVCFICVFDQTLAEQLYRDKSTELVFVLCNQTKTLCLHCFITSLRNASWYRSLENSNMAGSMSSSMEGAAFSDSDMSIEDDGSSSVAQRDKNLIGLLKQENRVLKMELETCKLRYKSLQEENRMLRKASVSIVSGANFLILCVAASGCDLN